MDLTDYLRRLLAPHRVGDELAPGARWTGVSSELGLLLRLEVDGAPLGVSVEPLEQTPRWAARSDRLAFGYRTEGGRQSLDPERGKQICDAIAERARGNEEAVMQEIAQASGERARQGEHRIRQVQVRSLLDPAQVGEERFYTLSPYVGCLVGCRFCYAQSKLAAIRKLVGLPEVPWGSYVDVRANAPEILREELQTLPPRPIKLCPIVSDPYQPVERREELTRRCLEVIRDASRTWPAMLLTRTTLVLRDAELLASLPSGFVGVSLPTADDATRRHFEPRGASVAERADVLRTLRREGVRTFAVVQPVLPGPLEALADLLAETAESVTIDILRGEEGATEDFDDPRYAASREQGWQLARSTELRELLDRRGVPVWSGELPPALSG